MNILHTIRNEEHNLAKKSLLGLINNNFQQQKIHELDQSLHEPIIIFRLHKTNIGSLEITKIMQKKCANLFKVKVESENIFQIQFNYRTIIILESLGTYVPIPSSFSSKVLYVPVLFF